MLKLFPRVILADKSTELRLSGDELKSGTKVTVSVQSMENTTFRTRINIG